MQIKEAIIFLATSHRIKMFFLSSNYASQKTYSQPCEYIFFSLERDKREKNKRVLPSFFLLPYTDKFDSQRNRPYSQTESLIGSKGEKPSSLVLYTSRVKKRFCSETNISRTLRDSAHQVVFKLKVLSPQKGQSITISVAQSLPLTMQAQALGKMDEFARITPRAP